MNSRNMVYPRAMLRRLPHRTASLLMLVFLAFPTTALSAKSPLKICAQWLRTLGMGAAGLAVLPESTLLHFGWAKLTSRSPFFYLNGLQLWHYDFSGKKVLDIASGRSRFAQTINLFYGDTGAEGHAIDLFWRPPGKFGVNGDAILLPYADNSFDLVVSNLGLTQMDARSFRMAFDEALRVLKPGQDLRLTNSLPFVSIPALLRTALLEHPEVQSVRANRIPFLSMQTPWIITKKSAAELPSQEQLAAYYLRGDSNPETLATWRPSVLAALQPGADAPDLEQIPWILRKSARAIPLLPAEREVALRVLTDPTSAFYLREKTLQLLLVENSQETELDADFNSAWLELSEAERSVLVTALLKKITHPAQGPGQIALLQSTVDTQTRAHIEELWERRRKYLEFTSPSRGRRF